MTESCATCKHKYKLEKWDYSRKGCAHTDMEGHICMAFAGEGTAVWKCGTVMDWSLCECYQPKETSNQTKITK